MKLKNSRSILLCLAILLLSSTGCVRAQQANYPYSSGNYQTQQTTESDKMTSYQELIVSLVSDSLNILPTDISDKISEAIKDGMDLPDQDDEIDKTVFTQMDPDDIGIVAGLIVQKVYGKNLDKSISVPQTVLYSYDGNDIDSAISTAVTELSGSKNRDRDAYNACLNLLVNTLLNKYAVDNQAKNKPTEGIYLRDVNEELYLHSEG